MNDLNRMEWQQRSEKQPLTHERTRERVIVPSLSRSLSRSCNLARKRVSRTGLVLNYSTTMTSHTMPDGDGATEPSATSNLGFVMLLTIFAGIGGFLFGYDTGVVSGAILLIQEEFDLSDTMQEIVISSAVAGAILGSCLYVRSATCASPASHCAHSLGASLAPAC